MLKLTFSIKREVVLRYSLYNNKLCNTSIKRVQRKESIRIIIGHLPSFIVMNHKRGEMRLLLCYKQIINHVLPVPAIPKKKKNIRPLGLVMPSFFLWQIDFIQKHFFTQCNDNRKHSQCSIKHVNMYIENKCENCAHSLNIICFRFDVLFWLIWFSHFKRKKKNESFRAVYKIRWKRGRKN